MLKFHSRRNKEEKKNRICRGNINIYLFEIIYHLSVSSMHFVMLCWDVNKLTQWLRITNWLTTLPTVSNTYVFPFFGWQDALIIKPPKKPPASLRMLVLVFAMACGLYICSICLKQTNVHTSTKFINIEVNQRHCNDDNIDRSQIPYLHYPRPNSFNRQAFQIIVWILFLSFL